MNYPAMVSVCRGALLCIVASLFGVGCTKSYSVRETLTNTKINESSEGVWTYVSGKNTVLLWEDGHQGGAVSTAHPTYKRLLLEIPSEKLPPKGETKELDLHDVRAYYFTGVDAKCWADSAKGTLAISNSGDGSWKATFAIELEAVEWSRLNPDRQTKLTLRLNDTDIFIERGAGSRHNTTAGFSPPRQEDREGTKANQGARTK